MSTSVTPEQVEKVVFDALATLAAEPDNITREATFEELDIDSLDLAELSQIVDDELGVELTSNDMASITTVGDAVDVIAARA
jgi:acyl carrier protein